jgi:hypothetical protein
MYIAKIGDVMSDVNQDNKEGGGLDFSVEESKSNSFGSNTNTSSTTGTTSGTTSATGVNSTTSSHVDKNDKKDDDKKEKSLKLLGSNNRVIPTLIEDLLSKNIPVILDKEGYLVGGFYGAEVEGRKDIGVGFVMLKDADQDGTFIAFDHKGKKHPVHGFHDLVVLNNNVWRGFYKQAEYRRAHPLWFDFMYEYGVLEIVPGKF